MDSQLTSYVVTGVVVLLVLALRWRRAGRSRPLKLEQLWVIPAIYVVVVVALFFESPPTGNGWLWCLVALAAGAAFGWYRGRLVAVTVDPATHALNQRASPFVVILLAALIALRYGLRTVLAQQAASWQISAPTIVDIFMAFALGLIAVQRLEIFLRGRRLLEAARAS